MKYSRTKMELLVKQNGELGDRLREIMKEMELEKAFALKALYHAEVTDGGEYQRDYQEL